MKELEELTREIREKLPRLKIEFGEINPIFINDVIDWLSYASKSELVIDFYGGIGEVIFDKGGYYISTLGKWDLSTPYLEDQSPELLTFLHSLIKTKQ